MENEKKKKNPFHIVPFLAAKDYVRALSTYKDYQARLGPARGGHKFTYPTGKIGERT